MKSPDFLMVTPTDIGRVGALGAIILAAVRYMTELPGEANGRRMVDGETWWRASHDDIGQALGGGPSRRTVSWAVTKLLETGDLVAIPTQDFYGDRAQAYRASEQPLARSDQGSEQPLARSDHPIGKIRPSTSARSDQAGCTDLANLPSTGELEEHSVGEKARTQRGTRLEPDWRPPSDVIEAIRAECPDVDLRAAHAKFVDYWTDKTGKDATKRSWVGTWRNWIRNEAKYQGRGSRNGVSTADQRVAQIQALKHQPPRLEIL